MYANGNKFEKQVQEKLEELRFVPSSSVWDSIEGQLPPEKKQPGTLLWSSLIVAAVAVCGYLFFYPQINSYNDTTSTQSIASSGSKTQKHTESIKPAVPNSVNPGAQTGSDAPSTAAGEIAKTENSIPSYQQQLTVKNVTAKDKSTVGKRTGESNSSTALSVAQEKNNRPVSSAREGGVSASSAKNIPVATAKENVAASSGKKNLPVATAKDNVSLTPAKDNTPVAPGKDLSDKSATNDQPAFLTSAAKAPEDNTARMMLPAAINGVKYDHAFKVDASIKSLDLPSGTAKLNKKKKWSLELSASAGQSIYNEGKVNKLFTAAEPNYMNRNEPNPAFGIWIRPSEPSEVKPGIGYSVGLNTRYEITSMVSVTAGVHYTQLSTTMKTGDEMTRTITIENDFGQKRDIEHYYDGGYTNDYTNRYHFVELPLLLYVQLNRGKKVPLYINGGVSVSSLVNTNAMHYDASKNIYYEDKEFFNKTFLNFQGGASAHFFAAKRFSLLVGPQVSYGTTELLKSQFNNGSSKHSLFIGLKAGVPLNF